ncbi:uncharacterized protein N7483_001174 [Penicillium malachiteum]|uniref:uncharacterized protein n=1 Tax=Penicillium malachiteum TaxID=1324776 RepID=UPI002546BBA9|nr:uncharacterized protein N7483_001174 [Penicillium malachiteum]KAJ5736049.1 hypothetical protein N7483_001174 [Penicillium malachiteum]
MADPSQHTGLAATWTLQTGNPPPTEWIALLQNGRSSESLADGVFMPDDRCIVDPVDYKDGGKYRSIVKLQMTFEGMPPKMATMGTGWLIRPDILVTSGQCVYDHDGNDGQGYGRVSTMHCHIGYNGRDSLKGPSVQSRYAKKIVTTGEWIDSRDNINRDVAFVKLDVPFTGNLCNFSYAETPMKRTELIGIVGYPGDEHLTDEEWVDEIGAQMYELFHDIRFDLEDHPSHILQHRVSAYSGQSGSPILCKRTQVSIGTHCSILGDKNSASTIRGQYGIDYDAYISALTTCYPIIKSIDCINFVKPSNLATTTKVPNLPSHNTLSPDLMSKGDFLNALQSVIGVNAWVGEVNKSITSMSPLLEPLDGPLDGPLSAVAGSALAAIIQAAGTESDFVSTTQATHGATERAVLAESILQSVLRIEDTELMEKLMHNMRITYSELAPHVTNIAAKMTHLLKDSALTIAATQDSVRKSDNLKIGERGGISNDAESVPGINAIQAPSVEGVLGPATISNSEGGFFDKLVTVFRKGLEVGGPFMAGPTPHIQLEILNEAWAPSGEGRISQAQIAHNSDLKNDESSVLSDDAIQAPVVEGVLGPTAISNSETSFSDELLSFIHKSVKTMEPLTRKASYEVVKKGWPTWREQSVSLAQTENNSDLNTAVLLTQRAVMAEAALCAVIKLETNDVARVSNSQKESQFGAQGFFDSIKSMAQVIGDAVSEAAPKVMNAILPIAVRALGKEIAVSSSNDDDIPAPPARGKRSPSIAGISDDHNLGSALELSALSL